MDMSSCRFPYLQKIYSWTDFVFKFKYYGLWLNTCFECGQVKARIMEKASSSCQYKGKKYYQKVLG